MKKLGIDIGTTNIKVLLIDNNILKEIKTYQNDFIDETYIQDGNKIYENIKNALDYFYGKYNDIKTIGITGQMHGIIYTDLDYNILSPLYTWCFKKGKEVQNELFELIGEKVNIGYGLLTHFYNMKKNSIPKIPYKILTIYDFVANKLSNNKEFITHTTSANSMGIYDLEKNSFKFDLLAKAGIKNEVLPKIVNDIVSLGTYKNSLVTIAIGDNQASFYGTTQNDRNTMLLNFGTASQITLRTEKLKETKICEIRPYLFHDYIITGNTLCGGKSFESLCKFFQSFSGEPLEKIYEKMLNVKYRKTTLKLNPYFLGTRQDDNLKASYVNLDLNNFTFDDFVLSTLEGMSNELLDFYKSDMEDIKYDKIKASGQGIRKNKLLVNILENTFKSKVEINLMEEEAAFGASLLGDIILNKTNK